MTNIVADHAAPLRIRQEDHLRIDWYKDKVDKYHINPFEPDQRVSQRSEEVLIFLFKKILYSLFFRYKPCFRRVSPICVTRSYFCLSKIDFKRFLKRLFIFYLRPFDQVNNLRGNQFNHDADSVERIHVVSDLFHFFVRVDRENHYQEHVEDLCAQLAPDVAFDRNRVLEGCFVSVVV